MYLSARKLGMGTEVHIRMKILFVSEMIYGSPQGATTLAASHLKLLESLYGAAAIDVCCINLEGLYDPAKDRALEVIDPTNGKLQRLVNVLSKRMYFLSSYAENRIVRLAVDGAYDAVWFDCSMYGGAAARIRSELSAAVIVTFYHFNAVQRYFQVYLDKPNLPRLFYSYTGSIPQELQHLRASDINYVLTPRDKSLFSAINNVRDCKLLPMMIDDLFDINCDEGSFSQGGRTSLLFVGSTYWPNIEGINWFARTVMPRLGDKCILKVVGRGLEALRDSFSAYDYIEVVGSCESLAEQYRSADLVVAPILHGDGMKTKVAEALMYGKRVLGTTEALVGYEESACVLCDTPDDFVREIMRCIDRGDLGFRSDARANYVENYSLDALRIRVNSDIETVLNERMEK